MKPWMRSTKNTKKKKNGKKKLFSNNVGIDECVWEGKKLITITLLILNSFKRKGNIEIKKKARRKIS